MAAQLPPDLPKTVKTVLQEDYASDTLTLKQTPLPVPTAPDDVLIQVHATSPCKGELTWGRNFPGLVPPDKLPVVSQEISGRVVAASSADSPFRVGDEVFGRLSFTRPGGAREYTIAAAAELALKPRALSFLEAAATPLSALTAWQAAFVHGPLDAAALTAGDDAAAADARARNARLRVLVTGAGGGVGRFLVQLAALAGAGAVVAVAGGGDGQEAALRALGATDVVDYHVQSAAAWVAGDAAGRECDLVVDGAGGSATADCWGVVKEGGTLLCLAADPNAARPAGNTKKPAKASWFLVESLGSQLATIAKLIDGGKLRPTIDSVFELDNYAEAFERLESGKAKGKIVIKVDGLV